MAILSIYVPDEAVARLERWREWKQDGRTVEELAEAAVEEASLDCLRDLPAPPLPLPWPLPIP